MKKVLCTIPFLFLIACAHADQKLILDFNIKNQASTIGANRALNVDINDNRVNKEVIGKRIFSAEDAPKIKIDANLAEILRQKITQNLTGRGFKLGNDKIVELNINTLSYDAKIGYPVGTGRAEISIRVAVYDSKSSNKFMKNYGTVVNSKHFMYPLESTIAETVNNLLRDTLQEIVSDDSFLESLLK